MYTLKKWEELQKRMAQLEIKEEDIVEKFILGSGKGGQKIHKTSSCVYIKHIPTGLEVKSQKGRSRELNRFFARRELCSQIEEKREGVKSPRRIKIDKLRRQKQKRLNRSKDKYKTE